MTRFLEVAKLPHDIAVDDDPVDHIEPTVSSRDRDLEVLERAAAIFDLALTQILDARSREIAVWGIIFALGRETIIAGRSMAQVADKIGCERAAISRASKAFARAASLPPSPWMRSEAACSAYRKTRMEKLR